MRINYIFLQFPVGPGPAYLHKGASIEDYDPFCNHLALKLDQDIGIKRHKKCTNETEEGLPKFGPLLIGTDGEGLSYKI